MRQKNGDINLNSYTDLVFEVKNIHSGDNPNFTQNLGTTDNQPATFNGVSLIKGELYLGTIKTKDCEPYNTAGKILSHERWAHGYMFSISSFVLQNINNSDYKPGFDDNTIPYDISAQEGLIKTKRYSTLQDTETYGKNRVSRVNSLFIYDKMYKNIKNTTLKTILLQVEFSNKPLKQKYDTHNNNIIIFIIYSILC
eukprot:TRINITY_DN7057_c0_g2_i1.p3 TRINITY_DN7057_c0_g2~~TRINITY_DN7057_c0_g2_i1.p3  ORF type:complete len:197 (-),score=18.54 TRINITY_DN7057_c0_g2_i1:503-1093(-)